MINPKDKKCRMHFIHGGHYLTLSLDEIKDKAYKCMCVQILSSLKSRHDLFDEIIIYYHNSKEYRFSYEGLTIVATSNFDIETTKDDFIFIRGDKNYYLPLLKKIRNRNHSLFYAASGKGIPSRWAHYHGYLFDDQAHYPIFRKLFKGAYLGCFIKTVNTDLFKPLDIEKEYDLIIVTNSGPAKNLPELAKILNQLKDLKIIICGELNDKSKALFSGSNIELVGFVKDNLNLLLNKSRIGLMPSNEKDGSPRVITEYLASGIPVLANFRTTGISKFVIEEAGEICPISQFPQKAREMLANLDQYDARKVFDQNFSLSIVADSFAEHITHVQKMPIKSPKRSMGALFMKLRKLRIDDIMKKLNDKAG